MTKAISSMVVTVVLALVGSTARADLAAVWAEGHGGLAGTSAETSASDPSMAGFGFQLGARVLIFEGYMDHTRFAESTAVTRGILGLRGGFGSRDLRLVLRGGLGVIDEEGGAVTGRVPGTPERRGAVARAGVAVESRLAPALLAGFGVDGERFALPMPGAGGFGSGTVDGSDIFASLKLMFELGV